MGVVISGSAARLSSTFDKSHMVTCNGFVTCDYLNTSVAEQVGEIVKTFTSTPEVFLLPSRIWK